MEDPSAPRMRYKLIGLGKLQRVSKSPLESRIGKSLRKPKKSKWAKDAQEGNGTKEPANNIRKGPVNTLSHWKGDKQQAQRGTTSPKRPSMIELNNITAGIAEWNDRKC